MEKFIIKKTGNPQNDLTMTRIQEFNDKVNSAIGLMKGNRVSGSISYDEKKLCATVANEEMIKEFLLEHPKNENINVVLQKVRLIDYVNSTNLRMYDGKITFYDIAKLIIEIPDFDERVRVGDMSLVKLIADTPVNLFSFASKYCCYHNNIIYNRDDYSIYDNALMKTIPRYIAIPNKSYLDKECRQKMDYEEYNRIIKGLVELYEIHTAFPIRDTDFYLWYHNKG